MNQVGPFVVTAASGRAIARSVLKAGYRCSVVDLFADRDTADLCHTVCVRHLSGSELSSTLNEMSGAIIPGTGCSTLWDGGRTVVGTSFDSWKKSRDPFFLKSVLDASGIETLSVRSTKPKSGKWVRKPFRSGGGRGVKLVDFGEFDEPDEINLSAGHPPNADRNLQTGSSASPPMAAGNYWQMYADGDVLGASFVNGQDGCHLVGCCKQNVARVDDSHFVFLQSVGPVDLPNEIKHQISRMGTAIARGCRLTGWFGIDVVMMANGVRMLEVNPRYTASMEILERVLDRSLFPYHLDAVRSGQSDGQFPSIGKAVLSSSQDWRLGKRYVFHHGTPVRVCKGLSDRLMEQTKIGPGWQCFLTDIPKIGAIIHPGNPVCTVWSKGRHVQQVEFRLDELDRWVCGMVNNQAGEIKQKNGPQSE